MQRFLLAIVVLALGLVTGGCPAFAPPDPLPDNTVLLAPGPGFTGISTPWEPTSVRATWDVRVLNVTIWRPGDPATRQMVLTTPVSQLPAGTDLPIEPEGGATTLSYEEVIMGIPVRWVSTGGGRFSVINRKNTTATVHFEKVPMKGVGLGSGSVTVDYRGLLDLGY